MIETDRNGTAHEVDDLDGNALLVQAQDAVVAQRIAERRVLNYAARWCVLHPAKADTEAARWSELGERDVLGYDETIGGDGTPLVAAFTAEPLAAALGVSTRTGLELMADALNLLHRLPLAWGGVQTLDIAPWRARRLAKLTASLSLQAARYVDEQLVTRIDSCGPVTIDRVVTEAKARYDTDQVADAEDQATKSWGVRLTHGRPGTWAGTSWLEITGDTTHLTRMYDLIGSTAEHLKARGDTDDLETRKARAVGVIADQAADRAAGQGGVQRGNTKLYLHIHADDLDHQTRDGVKVGSVEKLGPATLTKIHDWLTGSNVTILPVLDFARTDVVDQHDPPRWMDDQVRLRDPHCVFPWCERHSRSCDLDHINRYDPGTADDPGPPGQTRPENLAPLCRRHHRCKTRGRWRYLRNPDGTYTWTSPHGRTYQVTPTGTHPWG
ncbi:HNH endonuclease signature motif containing protein [Nocardioides sp.]|uniref:HNH endonuclease signature motif containing protein n=1 Tax=Nocardioides sp. TaxID=35761 RepID=UPI0031FEB25B|nr:hypothetical protein [Nocardioides sp.]